MVVGSSKYQWVCPKMDSQLASVLTSASLDVQNGSQCAEGSGPLTDVLLEPKEKPFPRNGPGNLLSCPVKAAVTIRNDALSINGKKPEAGVMSKPASQETSKIGGFRKPITVKTGVPVLQSQPITVKIVVPRGCKRPITNSTICLTKDLAHSHCQIPVLLSSGEGLTEKNTIKSQMSERKIDDVKNTADTPKSTEDAKAESFHETEAERLENLWNESTATVHCDRSDTPLVSNTYTLNVPSRQGIKEETTEREIEESNPQSLEEMDLKLCKTFDEWSMEEQTEPLDLSLPKKRESRERRCGRFLEDSGCESSLIMEVDEYEGEGDRDIVEEDDEGEKEDFMLCMDGTDTLEDSLLSSSFFSTSVCTSLSSIDMGNVLLIDDQGIPYTVSPDGIKMPQVDASISEDPHGQAHSTEVEGRGSPCLTSEADSSLSHSLDNSLNTPSDDLYPSEAPVTNASSLGGDQSDTPEVFTNSVPFLATEPISKSIDANAVLLPSSGISVNTQPIPILPNSSTNTPIFLLPTSSSSPQIPSSGMSLTLPLSVTQTLPCTSTPLFLLLSSVPSSSGDSTSTSTPVAVLDPSTGQLSQITAASAPVCFPFPSGQMSTLGSPMPTMSQPTIRLSPIDTPLILPGLNNINATSVLTSVAAQSSSPAFQNDNSSTTALLHSKIISSNLNSGSEAISGEEVSNENNKPSTSTASSPHPQSATLTYDPLAQPSSQVQSPASETQFDPPDPQSQHLPLDDHLYFANSVAPPSPPFEPILSTSPVKPKPLDSLEPLELLSSVNSTNTTNPRRVLYCQLCPRVFFYLSDLERHAITHSQKKPHVCHQCGKAFKRSSHLQRHKHIHTGQRNFICPICTKRFREAGELQRHQRVHTGEKPYQCQLCHTRFAERNTLRRHTKRKHPYHQVAIEMLNERRGGGRRDEGGGGSTVQEDEESAEWYSSTVSNMENSESEAET